MKYDGVSNSSGGNERKSNDIKIFLIDSTILNTIELFKSNVIFLNIISKKLFEFSLLKSSVAAQVLANAAVSLWNSEDSLALSSSETTGKISGLYFFSQKIFNSIFPIDLALEF